MEKVLSSLQAFFFLLVFSKASLLYFIGLSLKTVVLVFPIKLFFCLLSLPAFWTMYIIIDSVWLFFSVLFLKLQNLTSEIFLPFSILSFLSVNFLSDIIVYVFFFLQSIDFCGGIVCLFFFFFFLVKMVVMMLASCSMVPQQWWRWQCVSQPRSNQHVCECWCLLPMLCSGMLEVA